MNSSNNMPHGESNGADTLMNLVYNELRRSARARLRAERAEHSLQPTALVHEVYIQLKRSNIRWNSETEFKKYAAKVMRNVLIDHARRRKLKAQMTFVTWGETADKAVARPIDVLALDEALDRLEKQEPQLAQLIELRFFGGLTVEETAEETRIPLGTLKNKLAFARSWLLTELTKAP